MKAVNSLSLAAALILGSLPAEAADCSTTVQCAQMAVEAAARAEAAAEAANAKVVALAKAFRTFTPYRVTCPRGSSPSCVASCLEVDEVLIGGECMVPGKGENGTGYTQNVGVVSNKAWNCAMSPITPNGLGDVRATAWCVKLPQ